MSERRHPRAGESPPAGTGEGRRLQVRLAPVLITGVLVLATCGVWRLQVQHQDRLLARHTEDVCVQAARRLQTFVGAQLAMAAVLGEDWARHGGDGSERDRFATLASLVLAEFRSFHAIALVDSVARPLQVVNEPDSSVIAYLDEHGQELLALAPRHDGVVLSDPYQVQPGDVSFFAAWTLGQAPLDAAHVVVEYRVNELIEDCFHGQIRAEFSYMLEDEGESLFRFAVASPQQAEGRTSVRSVHTFPVHNRQWRLTVVPRPEVLADQRWRAALWVPALGLGLSIGVGILVHLLQVRADRFGVSEARYRGVFEAATDGLLVLARDGTILDANRATRWMLEREISSLVGLQLSDLVTSDPRSSILGLTGQLEEHPAVRLEARASRGDGSSRDLEIRVTRFVHQGRPAALVVMTDITERRTTARRQALLSRRAIAAQEEERARVARELHDDLGQLLTGLRLELDFIRRGHPRIAESFATVTDIVDTAVRSLRRLCRGLRPPLLDDLGLEASVRQLVTDFTKRVECRVELSAEVDEEHGTLPREATLCAYRVLQEALTNVSRHAHAHAVRVEVGRKDGDLFVEVSDDGLGFDMADLPATSGLGITGMTERAALVGGRLEVASTRLGGTTVTLEIPLPPVARAEAS